MADDDEKSLHEKIGYMRAEIKGVGEKVDKVITKVDCVDRKLVQLNGSTVKHEQCESKHQDLSQRLDRVHREVAKKQSRPEMPVVSENSQPSIPAFDDVTAEEEESKKSLLIRVKENVSAIVVILGALGLLGTGFYKLAHLLVKVETAIDRQEKEAKAQTKVLKQELRKVGNQPPRVIYVPVFPDAGTKLKRPRRRHR